MHKKMTELSDAKNCLIKWVSSEIDKGKDQCCSTYEETKIMGEIVDMIKDLAEAEKECMEACYYKEIVSAMHEGEPEDQEWDKVFGYNNRRYSSGRYAPAGRGHMGYTPMHGPYMMDEPHQEDYGMARMGYDRSVRSTESGNTTRYGYSYDRYRDARRHYTETKSPEEKQKMHEHAKEHLDDTIVTMRDIWKDADPELKSKMKTEMSKLVNDMH